MPVGQEDEGRLGRRRRAPTGEDEERSRKMRQASAVVDEEPCNDHEGVERPGAVGSKMPPMRSRKGQR
jgi:hypothetical protein